MGKLSESHPLSLALAKHRAELNARFASKRAMGELVDPAEFSDHLAQYVAPVIEAVDQVDAAAAVELTLALFDLSLELFSIGAAGPNSRHPLIQEAWTTLFPKVPTLLVADSNLPASICNAILYIDSHRNIDGEMWLLKMTIAAQLCESPAMLLDYGKVASWTGGLAHFRQSALYLIATLPPELAAKALEIDAKTMNAELLAKLRNDPWFDPRKRNASKSGEIAMVARIGGFRGFDGPFAQPPKLALTDGTILMRDGDTDWMLFADAYGATWKRVRGMVAIENKTDGGRLRIDSTGTVVGSKQTKRFAMLAGNSGFVSTATGMAVTMPYSHYVFLVTQARGSK